MRLIVKKNISFLLALTLSATVLTGCSAIENVKDSIADGATQINDTSDQTQSTAENTGADSVQTETNSDSQGSSITVIIPDTEIDTTLPDECELTEAEMLDAIVKYGNSITNNNNAFYISKNSDNSIDFQSKISTKPFIHFKNVSECFGYLYNRHQVDILGNTTPFALGKAEDNSITTNGSTNAEISALTGSGIMTFDTANSPSNVNGITSFGIKNIALSTSNTINQITIDTNASFGSMNISSFPWMSMSGGNGEPIILTSTSEEAQPDEKWTEALKTMCFAIDTNTTDSATFKFSADDINGNVIASGESSIMASSLKA